MNNESLTPLQRFFKLLRIERNDILQIFYYAVFSGLVSLSLPLGIQAIVNLIQGAQISTSWIILVILVTLGVVLVGILNLMQLRIIETIQQRIFIKSSFELSYRFPKIKMQALRNEYPPELANRFFDTLTIQKGLSKVLLDVPTALLQVVFALILLSFYHSLFIVFGIVLLVTVFFVFQYTAKKGLETSLKESKFKYKVAHWIQEIARSIISFKLSGKTNLALTKNDLLAENYLQARESHFRIIRFQYIKMIAFKAIITWRDISFKSENEYWAICRCRNYYFISYYFYRETNLGPRNFIRYAYFYRKIRSSSRQTYGKAKWRKNKLR